MVLSETGLCNSCSQLGATAQDALLVRAVRRFSGEEQPRDRLAPPPTGCPVRAAAAARAAPGPRPTPPPGRPPAPAASPRALPPLASQNGGGGRRAHKEARPAAAVTGRGAARPLPTPSGERHGRAGGARAPAAGTRRSRPTAPPRLPLPSTDTAPLRRSQRLAPAPGPHPTPLPGARRPNAEQSASAAASAPAAPRLSRGSRLSRQGKAANPRHNERRAGTHPQLRAPAHGCSAGSAGSSRGDGED